MEKPSLGRDGGTGRRSGLKIRRPSGLGGSTPPPGTKPKPLAINLWLALVDRTRRRNFGRICIIVPKLCPYLLLLLVCLQSFLLDSSFAFLQLQNRVIHIRATHDRIPLKYAASAPAADLHDDSLSNSSHAKISCPRSPQIVKQQVRHPRMSASVLPHASEIAHGLAV